MGQGKQAHTGSREADERCWVPSNCCTRSRPLPAVRPPACHSSQCISLEQAGRQASWEGIARIYRPLRAQAAVGAHCGISRRGKAVQV